MRDSPEKDAIPARTWLGLSLAARHLGVHYTTLRRWADAGEVPCLRTPGGQRRFAVSDLEHFVETRRQVPQGNSLATLQNMAVELQRREMQQHGVQHQGWVARFSPDQRLSLKRYGQQLVGLLLQFMGAAGSGDTYLEEARQIAHEHGAACTRAGLNVTDAVSAVLFFRHTLFEMAYESGLLQHLDTTEGRRVYQRLSDFLDVILLATTESYHSDYTPDPGGRPEQEAARA